MRKKTMPTPEIKFEPGTIVHVSGASFAGQKSKDRYYVVISKYSKIPANDTFMCLPITSWERDDPFMIKIRDSDFERGGLTVPSQVACDQIHTFKKERMDSEKGKLKQFFYNKIKQTMKEKILEI